MALAQFVVYYLPEHSNLRAALDLAGAWAHEATVLSIVATGIIAAVGAVRPAAAIVALPCLALIYAVYITFVDKLARRLLLRSAPDELQQQPVAGGTWYRYYYYYAPWTWLPSWGVPAAPPLGGYPSPPPSSDGRFSPLGSSVGRLSELDGLELEPASTADSGDEAAFSVLDRAEDEVAEESMDMLDGPAAGVDDEHDAGGEEADGRLRVGLYTRLKRFISEQIEKMRFELPTCCDYK
ncbi:unnamed protein product [Urochloa humidicola]